MSVDYRILINNKYVYDCMKRSERVKDWRWASGDTMAGWDPYNIRSRLLRTDAIVLLVRDDGSVTYTPHAEYFERAVPWAQWCIKHMEEEEHDCNNCKYHDLQLTEEPCLSCSGDTFDKWERSDQV